MIRTLLLIAFTFVGGHALNAQELGIANVPFSFEAGPNKMSAGKYLIREVGPAQTALFHISDGHGHSIFLMASTSRKANTKNPKLTFSCDRDVCVLVSMDLPGSNICHEFVPDAEQTGVLSFVRIFAMNR